MENTGTAYNDGWNDYVLGQPFDGPWDGDEFAEYERGWRAAVETHANVT